MLETYLFAMKMESSNYRPKSFSDISSFFQNFDICIPWGQHRAIIGCMVGANVGSIVGAYMLGLPYANEGPSLAAIVGPT